jgi:hypothetical protein
MFVWMSAGAAEHDAARHDQRRQPGIDQVLAARLGHNQPVTIFRFAAPGSMRSVLPTDAV